MSKKTWYADYQPRDAWFWCVVHAVNQQKTGTTKGFAQIGAVMKPKNKSTLIET